MDQLRQAALAVIAAALICGILMPMLHESAASQLLRMLFGVFVAVTLLSHVRRIDFDVLQDPVKKELSLAQQQTQLGRSMARSELETIIKDGCEAYILDKADQMDVRISAKVTLSEGQLPVPEEVSVFGALSAQQKEALSRMLTEDMGIAKEDQKWIG